MAYKSAMRRGSSVLLRRAPAAGGGGNVLGRHHRRSLSYAMTVASQWNHVVQQPSNDRTNGEPESSSNSDYVSFPNGGLAAPWSRTGGLLAAPLAAGELMLSSREVDDGT